MASELIKQVNGPEFIKPCLEWAEQILKKGLQAGPVVIKLGRPKRSIPQNKHMWACLTDISEQRDWHGMKLSPEEWKDLITAALKKQKIVPGIEGGFVVIGGHTSKMTIGEMSDVIEMCYMLGAEAGVKFKQTVTTD